MTEPKDGRFADAPFQDGIVVSKFVNRYVILDEGQRQAKKIAEKAWSQKAKSICIIAMSKGEGESIAKDVRLMLSDQKGAEPVRVEVTYDGSSVKLEEFDLCWRDERTRMSQSLIDACLVPVLSLSKDELELLRRAKDKPSTESDMKEHQQDESEQASVMEEVD
jgi:hypothetical protein